MKQIKKNKKGFTPQEVIIGIIITLISFYVILGFFTNNVSKLSTPAQDLLCRATIEAKASSSVKIAGVASDLLGIDSFLNVLNNKCSIDYITINNQKEEETYKAVGDSMTRCWYRYGEGKADFLTSFQTTGNWCFVCGVAKFKEDNKNYDYNKFIEWTKRTEYKKDGGKSVSYYDYMEMRYTEVNPEQLDEIQMSLNDILNEKDSAFKQVAIATAEQYNALNDLRLKKISSLKKMG